MGGLFGDVERKQRAGFVIEHRFRAVDVLGPVSYTHLDVYKRQIFIFHIGGHVDHFVGDDAGGLIDTAVRGFHEAVLVDLSLIHI